MDENHKRLCSIERKLDKHGEALQEIRNSLSLIAVQQEQISQLTNQINSLWTKWDAFTGPNGQLNDITTFQASCPRKTVKWLWLVVIPMGMALLASAFAYMRIGIGQQ